MSGGPPSLAMVRVALSDARTGDGFRTAFVLAQRKQSAVLYVPSLLTSVAVPARSLGTAQTVRYRPKVVRGHMLARARLYRRHGHRFSQQATVEVLRRLGAARAVIEETVSTARRRSGRCRQSSYGEPGSATSIPISWRSDCSGAARAERGKAVRRGKNDIDG